VARSRRRSFIGTLPRRIDRNRLPFRIKDSSRFGLPVPELALRVRELEMQATEELGSHTFFVAKVLQEKIYAVCRWSKFLYDSRNLSKSA
jgi:hypothetical protein